MSVPEKLLTPRYLLRPDTMTSVFPATYCPPWEASGRPERSGDTAAVAVWCVGPAPCPDRGWGTRTPPGFEVSGILGPRQRVADRVLPVA